VHHALSEIAIVPHRHSNELLVLLHGRQDNWNGPRYMLTQPLLDALSGLGGRAPVVVLLNGGPHSYFHDRSDGAWASMILREAIPDARRRLHLRGPIAIGGISMGGYGALHLAELSPSTFCAVGVRSPAIWRTGGETAPGAFDDAEDFSRNDVIAGASRLRMPAWIDYGDHDPFVPGDRALAPHVHAQVHVWPGGHNGTYWGAHVPRFLRFFVSAPGC
jgi:pimeloyl-ACP methyl ester carboxylesterase